MCDPSWRLRPARVDDRDFLYDATMRAPEKVWGWDDAKQIACFENRFQPDVGQLIEAGGRDIGLLIVKHDVDQVFLAEIQVDPGWQRRGIGSFVVRSLMRDAAAAGKPLTLRVLHVNERARRLYERLGLRPFRNGTPTSTYAEKGRALTGTSSAAPALSKVPRCGAGVRPRSGAPLSVLPRAQAKLHVPRSASPCAKNRRKPADRVDVLRPVGRDLKWLTRPAGGQRPRPLSCPVDSAPTATS